MKKLFTLFTLLLIAFPAYASWDKDSPDIDSLYVDECFTAILTNQSAIDSLLAGYRKGARLTYTSESTVTVGSGQVVVSNSDGSVRLFLSNSSTTSVTFSNIDTGTESASTQYYVYAYTNSTSASTFSCIVSSSATSPTGATYYAKIGSFYNDPNSNMTLIYNNGDFFEIDDEGSAKSVDVVYQALYDGDVVATITGSDAGATTLSLIGYTGNTSSPGAVRGCCTFEYTPSDSSSQYHSFCMPVRQGQYYKVATANSNNSAGLYKYVYFFPKK